MLICIIALIILSTLFLIWVILSLFPLSVPEIEETVIIPSITDQVPEYITSEVSMPETFEIQNDEKSILPQLFLNPAGDSSKTAILIGINNYSRAVYQGQDLRLKGCVNDALSLKSLSISKGYGRIYLLTDVNATISNFLKIWKAVSSTAKDGDTILLSMSRHGMSLNIDLLDVDIVPETAGRNKDGSNYKGDQGAVMYDGVIVDDCFWRLFLDLPKVKLIYINDSCHSATQYRASLSPTHGAKRIPRTVSSDYMPEKGKIISLPQLDVLFGRAANVSGQLNCTLISIAGCQDFEYSMDAFLENKYRGAMTTGLLVTLKDNPAISIGEIQDKVTAYLAKRRFNQNPQIKIEGINKELIQTQPLF